MKIQAFQLLDLKEILDLQVLEVQLVHRENKVLLVLQDPLDLKANKVYKVYKAYKVSKVLLAQLALKEKLDLLALLVLKEIRVKEVNKDLKAFKVL